MTKKLTRSRNGAIAGVCGGLGDYFGLDPVLVRAIFLMLLLCGGGGGLFYIILWILVPREW
jgi:phage shock protein C